MEMLALTVLILLVTCAAGQEEDSLACDCGACCADDGKCKSSLNMVSMVRQNYACQVNCLLEEQIHWELRASYLYQAYAYYFGRADVSLPGIAQFLSRASLEERGHADYLIDYVNKRGGRVRFDQVEIKNTCETVWNASQHDKSGLCNSTERMCEKNTCKTKRESGHKESEDDLCKDNQIWMCLCGFVSTDIVNNECALDRMNWMEGLMAFEDALSVERFVNKKLLCLHKKADQYKDAHLTHILEHDFLEEQVQAIYELGLYVTRLRAFLPPKGQDYSGYKLGEYLFDQKLLKSLPENENNSKDKNSHSRNYGMMG